MIYSGPVVMVVAAVMDHIDIALRAEWRWRWHTADAGRFLHDLFEDAREA